MPLRLARTAPRRAAPARRAAVRPVSGLPLTGPRLLLYPAWPFLDHRLERTFEPGVTVAEMLERASPDPRMVPHYRVYIGGDEIPPELWRRVRANPGVVVVGLVRFQGGGGGGGKSPLRMVLGLAVMVTVLGDRGLCRPVGGQVRRARCPRRRHQHSERPDPDRQFQPELSGAAGGDPDGGRLVGCPAGFGGQDRVRRLRHRRHGRQLVFKGGLAWFSPHRT